MTKLDCKIQAEIVEETLIISSLNSDKLGVWRINMPKSASIFFEIIADKERYNLLMREGKTKKQVITDFDSQEHANQALHAITLALTGKPSEKDHVISGVRAQKQQTEGGVKPNKRTLGQKAVLYVLAILAVCGFILSKTQIPQNSQILSQQTVSNSTQDARAGVPISAEELFGN